MSELDLERQEFLVKSLTGVQLFITTTELPEVLLQKFPSCSVFQVQSGRVQRK